MGCATSRNPYPTANEIRTFFTHLTIGEYAAFFSHFSPDVEIDALGTHPCAGSYLTLQEFRVRVLGRIAMTLKHPGLTWRVVNVVGGGKQEWCAVELGAEGECLNGVKFENDIAWFCRFDGNGKIVQLRTYLDGLMVQKALTENVRLL